MASSDFQVVLQARLSKDSLSNIQRQLSNLGTSTKIDIPVNKTSLAGINNITNSVSKLGDTSKASSKHLQTLTDKFSKFLQWQVIGDIIHGVNNAFHDMIDIVFNLDSTLTELAKVTDLTSEGLEKLKNDAYDVAVEIGNTGQSILDATVIFAQAGFEEQSLELAKWATILTNVSEAGATTEKSARTLIATMKAFNLETSDTEHIVDVLNEVDVFASRYSNVA